MPDGWTLVIADRREPTKASQVVCTGLYVQSKELHTMMAKGTGQQRDQSPL